MKRILVTLALCLFALAACTAPSALSPSSNQVTAISTVSAAGADNPPPLPATATPTLASPPTLTSPPTFTPLPSATPDPKKLSFNFDGESQELPTGWEVKFIPYDPRIKFPQELVAQIEDGQVLIENQGTYSALNIFYTGEIRSPDLLLTLEATTQGKAAGTILFCRYSDRGWYHFSVTEQRSYLWRVVVVDGAQITEEIVTGPGLPPDLETHSYELRCNGSELHLRVDQQELLSANDTQLPGGSFGFGVESQAETSNRKAFDNLQVEFLSFPPTPTATLTPTPLPTMRPTLAPSSTPTVLPTRIAEEDLLLYQTSFELKDDSLGAWRTFAYSTQSRSLTSDGFKAASDGRSFQIEAGEANQRIFSIYEEDFDTQDVDITLQSEIPRGKERYQVGLVCRSSTAGWYQFLVEPDGYWSVRLAKADEKGQPHFYSLSQGKYLFDRHAGANTLRAECKGSRLSFYANTTLLVTLEDDTLSSGRVGLTAWSLDRLGPLVSWQSFEARRAEWREPIPDQAAPTAISGEVVYASKFELPKTRLEDWFTFLVYPFANYVQPFEHIADFNAANLQHNHILYLEEKQEQYYIHAFAPETGDVAIEITMPDPTQEIGLVCRYSQDGWYEVRRVLYARTNIFNLVRMERGTDGILAYTYLGSSIINGVLQNDLLALRCSGNQISVELNGKTIIYAEDERWGGGRFGLVGRGQADLNLRSVAHDLRVLRSPARQNGDLISQEAFDDPATAVWNWQKTMGGSFFTEVKDGALWMNLAKDGFERLSFSGGGGNRLSNEGFISGVFADAGIQAREIALSFEIVTPETNLVSLAISCHQVYRFAHTFTIEPAAHHWRISNLRQELASGTANEIEATYNRFTIECVGKQLTLIANGKTIASVEDPTYDPYLGGSLELRVDGSRTDSPVKIDNIEMRIPLHANSYANIDPIERLRPAYLVQSGEIIYQTGFTYAEMGAFTGGNSGHFPQSPWNAIFGSLTYPYEMDQFSPPGLRVVNALAELQQDVGDLPVEIHAEGRLLDLTQSGPAMALVCRSSPAGLYEFSLQADGQWAIQRVWLPYDTRKLQALPLLQGRVDAMQSEVIHLAAVCDGPNLSFLMNGIELGTVEDRALFDGKVGLGATGEIIFSSFSVKRLR